MSTGSSYKKYKHKKPDLSHFMLDSVYKPIFAMTIYLNSHIRFTSSRHSGGVYPVTSLKRVLSSERSTTSSSDEIISMSLLYISATNFNNSNLLIGFEAT
ncbi:hypothetical protein FEC77_02700 [Rickettsia parkeri]|nr:hypothetical protein FEC77_02700 [Rickettsia parkeri]